MLAPELLLGDPFRRRATSKLVLNISNDCLANFTWYKDLYQNIGVAFSQIPRKTACIANSTIAFTLRIFRPFKRMKICRSHRQGGRRQGMQGQRPERNGKELRAPLRGVACWRWEHACWERRDQGQAEAQAT